MADLVHRRTRPTLYGLSRSTRPPRGRLGLGRPRPVDDSAVPVDRQTLLIRVARRAAGARAAIRGGGAGGAAGPVAREAGGGRGRGGGRGDGGVAAAQRSRPLRVGPRRRPEKVGARWCAGGRGGPPEGRGQDRGPAQGRHVTREMCPRGVPEVAVPLGCVLGVCRKGCAGRGVQEVPLCPCCAGRGPEEKVTPQAAWTSAA